MSRGDPPDPDPARTGSHEAVESAAALVPAGLLAGVPARNVTLLATSRVVAMRGARGPAADRFRYLRMRLEGLRTFGKLHTLTITSALPQDGKSTIALNLATILAEGDRHRVLLIEGDLHCPSFGKTLGIGECPGVAECLEKGLDPISALMRIQPLGFYLLPAGGAIEHPTDLIQPPHFPALVERLAPLFDWVLIDTPPVLPVTDAITIARHTDGTVLVVRAGATSRPAADEAVTLLSPSPIAAIVFNGDDDLNHYHRKYSYTGYYGSYSKPKDPAPPKD